MADSTMLNLQPELVAATLAWCNERRAEQGKEPLDKLPKGRRRDPKSCPCGKATELFVDFHTYQVEKNDGKAQPLPREVAQFVYLFDSGGLPEYDSNLNDD